MTITVSIKSIRMLELFKGTGSIGKAVGRIAPHVQVISLDLESKYNPTIVSDIMDWDYKIYPPGYFDMIWASPPCTYYSSMQNFGSKKREAGWLEGKRAESDLIIKRVLDIVNYYQPRKFLMENPQTGYLKSRDIMQGLTWTDCTYCMYGYPYKKQTRFWGTTEGLTLKLCNRQNRCTSWDGKKHGFSIGMSRTHSKTSTSQYGNLAQYYKDQGLTYGLEQKYSIPPPLCDELIKFMISF